MKITNRGAGLSLGWNNFKQKHRGLINTAITLSIVGGLATGGYYGYDYWYKNWDGGPEMREQHAREKAEKEKEKALAETKKLQEEGQKEREGLEAERQATLSKYDIEESVGPWEDGKNVRKVSLLDPKRQALISWSDYGDDGTVNLIEYKKTGTVDLSGIKIKLSDIANHFKTGEDIKEDKNTEYSGVVGSKETRDSNTLILTGHKDGWFGGYNEQGEICFNDEGYITSIYGDENDNPPTVETSLKVVDINSTIKKLTSSKQNESIPATTLEP